MPVNYSIERILNIVGQGADCCGSYEGNITSIASLTKAQAGDLSFLGNAKYKKQVQVSKASVLLLPRDFEGDPSDEQLFIRLDNPSYALALICRDIENKIHPRPPAGVHPTAYVESGAIVDPSASIGAFCYVGAGAQIDADVVLENHVSIGCEARISAGSFLFAGVIVANRCLIGERNRLLQGCVIGSDGYGYAPIEGEHQRIPQIGNVKTEADVDIGANSTIDRARFGTTLIGRGTKIDNLVQVAHNVEIGRHCLLVAQCGVSGSAELGNKVILAGQSGVAGHIKISDGTLLYAKSGAMRSTEPNEKISGTHGQEANLMNRIYILQRKLPELFKRFEQLEKYVESNNQETTS
jgi:UDP-3-O-[3-hydroxymyristoyl] glucosamine N-acyltransferase